MKYPVRAAILVVLLVGIILTAVYDDIIYPMDDGIISIGLVVLFALNLGLLIRKANRDEMRKKAEARAAKAGQEGSTAS